MRDTEACLCDALKEGPCLCFTQGERTATERILAWIDERIDSGRGFTACFTEAQTLTMVKNAIERGGITSVR